jgi:hypothetical protein
MANPPEPLDPISPVVTHGTIVHYGLADLTVTGILVDSYKRDPAYADVQEVTNNAGVVVGVRMGDYRANVSVDGRVLQNVSGGVDYTINVGDILTINGDNIVITNCSYSGQAKGFHSLSISGTAYSGIPTLLPKGVDD